MNKTAIILCAGSQERWEGHVQKQLVPVFNNETLLCRTIRQCNNRDLETYVITHDPDIIAHSGGAHLIELHTHDNYLCETLSRTRVYWNNLTIILLGDVCYSPKCLDTLINTEDWKFVGTRNELFGFSFTHSYIEMVDLWLGGVNKRVMSGMHGKLWQLYYVAHGMTGKNHYIQKYHMEIMDDYTYDFDVVSRYEKWYRENVKDE